MNIDDLLEFIFGAALLAVTTYVGLYIFMAIAKALAQ